MEEKLEKEGMGEGSAPESQVEARRKGPAPDASQSRLKPKLIMG